VALVEAESVADVVVDAELDAELDIWLCAASSASIVAGEICEPPPVNPVVPIEPVEVWPELGSANPLEVADELVEEVSDWIALTAVDAAPKANSMVKQLRYAPPKAAQAYMPVTSASAMPLPKAQSLIRSD
jgi:hypothetical protein